MLHDPLADAISAIKNAERKGKKECIITPGSKVIEKILGIMKKDGFVDSFEALEAKMGFKVKLTGNLNDAGVFKPRPFVKKDEYDMWEKRVLPSAGFGTLFVSTSGGIKSHREVKGTIGGVLLAFTY